MCLGRLGEVTLKQLHLSLKLSYHEIINIKRCDFRKKYASEFLEEKKLGIF